MKTKHSGALRNPYENLYIYYLEGQINSDALLYQDDFLGNWEEDQFSFLFFSKPNPDAIGRLLNTDRHLTLIDHYHMSYAQWQGGEPEPIKIGNFSIIPPWLASQADYSCTGGSILLDPGVVFGTGTHPTTRDCLEALEMAFMRAPIRTVLDLGTGTGLLALVATALGGQKTLAVDMNLLAARTAWRNVRLNCFQANILITQGDAKNFMDLPFDLVVSNIHYAVMKDLLGAPGFCAKRFFILSGLLRSEAKDIRQRLHRIQARIIETWEQDGIWHTFFGCFE
jgi:ribosomal protein L11 methyltransferase